MKSEWLLCRFADLPTSTVSPGGSGSTRSREQEDDDDEDDWRLLWVVATTQRIEFFEAKTDMEPKVWAIIAT